VVGSHEFYLGYSLTRRLMPCLDLGHFHPTESIADKISSLLLFCPGLLVHVSRGIRWDSDHVVIWDDQLRDVMAEIARSGRLGNIHIALDYFDASLNRIGAWVIGARATLKALLFALCEPTTALCRVEESRDYFHRLALLEELNTMPFGAVWDYHCLKHHVPAADHWIDDVLGYEKQVLMRRA
jgi:L-rhamnose isomerase